MLKNMEEARTPLEKQRYLDAALETISHAYSLSFPGKEGQKLAGADFRIPALLLVISMAKLKCPFATHKYMELYGYRTNEHGEDERSQASRKGSQRRTC